MTDENTRRTSPNSGWIALAIISLLAAIWFGYDRYFGERPEPETVVAVSLRGLQEQQRLVPFTASFVAVVTSQQTTLGLTAKKTLILPGTVRYELDLGLLNQNNLTWDKKSRTLDITLPPLELAGPEFALEERQEFEDGKLIMKLADNEEELDTLNLKSAKRELLAQAGAKQPMKLARVAAINAVENAFAMPLESVGIEASVKAHFEEEL